MNLFLGVGDVGSILNEWAGGFHKNGVKAKTAIHSKSPFFSHNEYDYNLSILERKLFKKLPPIGGYSNTQFFLKAVNLSSRLLQSLWFIPSFDAFIFVTPSLSIFKPDFDFTLIKQLNKKLIIICVGTDIRHISGFQQEFPTNENLYDDQFKNDPIERPLSNLRRAEKYADIIYSVPDQSSLAIRDYMHWQIPINVKDYNFNVPDRDIPVVLHAPSRKGIKGTDQILAALDQLKIEGYQFELRLLEKVNNKIIRDNLRDADLLVDELVLHGPGILSLEAMSSGCTVATKYLESSPFFKPPVLPIDDKNIYDMLKYILSNREVRKEMAFKGRQYVHKNNDSEIVTKKILENLSSLHNGTLTYDYKAEFFKKHYQLTDNVKLSGDLKKVNHKLAKKYWNDFEEYKISLQQRNLI